MVDVLALTFAVLVVATVGVLGWWAATTFRAERRLTRAAARVARQDRETVPGVRLADAEPYSVTRLERRTDPPFRA